MGPLPGPAGAHWKSRQLGSKSALSLRPAAAGLTLLKPADFLRFLAATGPRRSSGSPPDYFAGPIRVPCGTSRP
ncbi:hypothetical protein SPHINGO8AM_80267 [Sphingomonas sp. 8AM]|nr:hypothetical protein SPHINGO8AM_80267 [Sphingomonas sp. 8AM]